MSNALNFNPFEGLDDLPELSPAQQRDHLLDAARRGFGPFRREFVQRPNTEEVRAAKLAEIVHGRYHRSLDAFLLLHALEPVLRTDPLDMRTWARLLSSPTRPCTPNAASKAFTTLVDLQLVTRTGEGNRQAIRPLHESGNGAAWTRPGSDDESGPGFFVLPHEYWTEGYADRLTLPGKAMLLIMLAETHPDGKQAFQMAVDKAQAWYGISERTAERGYRELSREHLLLQHVQKIPDARHPAGRREIWHRALAHPFSTLYRGQLQKAARTAARKRAPQLTDAVTSSDS